MVILKSMAGGILISYLCGHWLKVPWGREFDIRVDVQHGSRNRSSHSATQPLSQSGWTSHSYHSGWVAEWLWQSGWSSHSATLAERLDQPLSHSATQPLWQSGWVAGPATLTKASARVAAPATLPLCQSGLVQPLSHSATLPERLSGWAAAPSHSGRMSQWVNS